MSGDLASVLQDLCYCGNSTCRYCGYARQAREMQAEIVRLRAEVERKHDYACRMDALAEERLMEVTRLRAERDASRLIISDLTAEAERLRVAGDRLAAAVNAVACSGPRDEMAELVAAYIDWQEVRRG